MGSRECDKEFACRAHASIQYEEQKPEIEPWDTPELTGTLEEI